MPLGSAKQRQRYIKSELKKALTRRCNSAAHPGTRSTSRFVPRTSKIKVHAKSGSKVDKQAVKPWGGRTREAPGDFCAVLELQQKSGPPGAIIQQLRLHTHRMEAPHASLSSSLPRCSFSGGTHRPHRRTAAPLAYMGNKPRTPPTIRTRVKGRAHGWKGPRDKEGGRWRELACRRGLRRHAPTACVNTQTKQLNNDIYKQQPWLCW